jgi:dUTP pyrophosphatase
METAIAPQPAAPLTVKFRKNRPDARLPVYATPGSAGMDVFALIDGDVTLAPGERALFTTGLSVELPPGYEAQMRPRSGLALKHGVTVLNTPGTIDSDYRGPVNVLLVNLGRDAYTVRSGDRIAQIVVAAVAAVRVVECAELGGSVRGEGGYGSTGI